MKRCPTCNREVQWQDNLFRPFCSERCKLVDLGKWVSDEYRVPGKPVSKDNSSDDQGSGKVENES